METTAEIKSALEEKVADLKVEIEETKKRLSSFGDKVSEYIKQNPGKCVLGAVALGYVIGKIARR